MFAYNLMLFCVGFFFHHHPCWHRVVQPREQKISHKSREIPQKTTIFPGHFDELLGLLMIRSYRSPTGSILGTTGAADDFRMPAGM